MKKERQTTVYHNTSCIKNIKSDIQTTTAFATDLRCIGKLIISRRHGVQQTDQVSNFAPVDSGDGLGHNPKSQPHSSCSVW